MVRIVLYLIKTVSTLESLPGALVTPNQIEASDGVRQQMVMADGFPAGLEGLEDGTGLESHPAEEQDMFRPRGGILLPASATTGK